MKNRFGEFDPEVLQVLKDAYNQDAESFAEGCDDTFDFKTCKRSDGTTYGVPDKSDCAQKGAKEVKPGKVTAKKTKAATSSWNPDNLAGKMGMNAADNQAGLGMVIAGTAAAALAFPLVKAIFDSDRSLNPTKTAKPPTGNRTYKGAANYKLPGGKVERYNLTMNIGPDGVYKGTWSDGVKADYKFKPNGKVDITSYTTKGTSTAEAEWYTTGYKTVIRAKNDAMTTINPGGLMSSEFKPRTGASPAPRSAPKPTRAVRKPTPKPTQTQTQTRKPSRDYQREANRSDSTRDLNRQMEADARERRAAHERRMQSFEMDRLRQQNQQLLTEMRQNERNRQQQRMFDNIDKTQRESRERQREYDRDMEKWEADREKSRRRTRAIQRQIFGGF